MRGNVILLFFLFLLGCSKEDSSGDNSPNQVTFDLSVGSSDGGSVDISGGTYNQNSEVTITATPEPGYAFSGWSGNASGSTNPLTLTMTGDKTITANFTRITFGLDVGVVGQGTVSKELINSSKTDEYNQGSVVRLNASSESPWLFIDWSGASTATTNQIDLTIDSSKSVTATFEERINQIVDSDNIFNGVGKWKIRRPSSSNKSQSCQVLEIIFRNDNSFTIITSNATITGQFSVDSNTSIILSQWQSPIGNITNLVLTNSFISFSINLNNGCDESIMGDKDDNYEDSTDNVQGCNEQEIISFFNSLKDMTTGDIKNFSFGNYYLTFNGGEATPTGGTFQGITYKQYNFSELNQVNGLGNEVEFFFSKDSGELLFIISVNRVMENGIKVISQIRRFYAPGFPSDGPLNYENSSYCQLWDAASHYIEQLPSFYEGKTHIPDDNFEQALIDLGYDDTLDDYVVTENISSISSLDLRNREISNMTGLEDFISITNLILHNNLLSSIDVSRNLLLESLTLSRNSLTSLDVSENIFLEELYISINNIESLDLSNNNSLIKLSASQNLLTSLNLSGNPQLSSLNLSGDFSNGGSNSSNRNRIPSIDLSNNDNLKYLNLSLVGIEGTIDTSNLDDLIGLVVSGNPNLISLDLSNNRELQWINAGYNGRLEGLDLTNQSNLAYLSLRAVGQYFTGLDVSHNNNLIVFDTTLMGDSTIAKCIKVSQFQLDNQINNNSLNGVTSGFTVYYDEGSGQIFNSINWSKDIDNSYELECN